MADARASDGTVHLDLPAILDDHAADLVRAQTDRILSTPPTVLVLDCTLVRFVDAGGLRFLGEVTRTGADYGTRVITYDPDRALAAIEAPLAIAEDVEITTDPPRTCQLGDAPAPRGGRRLRRSPRGR